MVAFKFLTTLDVGMVVFNIATSLRRRFFRAIGLQKFIKRHLQTLVCFHHNLLAFSLSHVLFEEPGW